MIPRPRPSYLDELIYFGVREGRQVWRNEKSTRYYTWDSQHGEIEVFDAQGRHLGAADALTGVVFKEAVRHRRINLQ